MCSSDLRDVFNCTVLSSYGRVGWRGELGIQVGLRHYLTPTDPPLSLSQPFPPRTRSPNPHLRLDLTVVSFIQPWECSFVKVQCSLLKRCHIPEKKEKIIQDFKRDDKEANKNNQGLNMTPLVVLSL